jgi:hypothetical protein
LAIAPDALPAPMTTVRPLGRFGRCAGTQSEGSAASTAAWNMAFRSSRGGIDQASSDFGKMNLRRRLQKGK